MTAHPARSDSHHQEGSRPTFDELVDPLIPALRLHCYRLVGSVDDAEDMVQEALIRAWRRRDLLPDREGVRPWLYRIATNACLDLIDHRRRRPRTTTLQEGDWPEPIPDGWLVDDRGAGDPANILIRREAIDLAFLTAVRALPPRPRAILVLRDVLEWPAADVAEALGMSEGAVHSAVRRARRLIDIRTPGASAGHTGDEWSIARRYGDAWERADMAGLADLLASDARMAMPPDPHRFEGRHAILTYFESILGAPPERRIRLQSTRANGGPAFIVLEPDRRGHTMKRIGIKVLLIREGRIAEIRGHMDAVLADRFVVLPRTPPEHASAFLRKN